MPTKTKKLILRKILKKHDAIENFKEAAECIKYNYDEIRKAVNQYEDEDQDVARLSITEDVLIENEIIEEPKLFPAPQPKSDAEFIEDLAFDEEPEMDFSEYPSDE